jgi:transposase
MAKTGSAAKVVEDIRRRTRRRFSAEEKIRIVLEGVRGEESPLRMMSSAVSSS